MPDGTGNARWRSKNAFSPEASLVTFRSVYQGFVFTDCSTRTEDGRFRARVAIMSLEGTRTRSQRFIDLEIVPSQTAAIERITAVAQAWIDTEIDKDPLSLPTNFSEFQ